MSEIIKDRLRDDLRRIDNNIELYEKKIGEYDMKKKFVEKSLETLMDMKIYIESILD